MDFGLTDEQLALQATARRFAREEIAPVASHYDQTAEFPREIIRRAWELGLASTAIPVEHGGVGLSILDTCLVTEEIAWGCAGFGTSIMCNDLGLTPILVAGSAEQQREWLGACAKRFTLCSTRLGTMTPSRPSSANVPLRVERESRCPSVATKATCFSLPWSSTPFNCGRAGSSLVA